MYGKGHHIQKSVIVPAHSQLLTASPILRELVLETLLTNALYLVQIANISKIQFSSAVLVAGGPGRFTMTRADL